MFPLYNGGDTVIGYEIGVGVLSHLTEENYLMPIFECLEPTGYIPPATTLPLEFVFSPMEAKRYSVSNICLVRYNYYSTSECKKEDIAHPHLHHSMQ